MCRTTKTNKKKALYFWDLDTRESQNIGIPSYLVPKYQFDIEVWGRLLGVDSDIFGSIIPPREL